MNSVVTKLMSLSTIQETAADWYARRIGTELTDEEERELGRWLAADPRHFREYQAMELLWNKSGEVAGVPAMTGLRSRVSQREAAVESEGAPAANRPWLVNMAIAASVVLVVLLSVVLMSDHTPAPVQILTEHGQQKSVTLEDGTLVELDADTHLTLGYTASERRVMLDSGQAHFSVYKDPSRPFVVTSGNSVVQAVGTEFQVYRRIDSVTITLLEGRVDVSSIGSGNSDRPADAAKPAWHERLEPGEQIVIKEAVQETPRVSEVDIDRVTAWRRGTLDFDAMPLPEVVTEINRYSDRPVHIADPDLNKVMVSGIFTIGDTDTMLLAFEKGFDIEARTFAGNTDIFLYAKTQR